MRSSLAGLCLLSSLAIGACGGEARKLGEVDVPGGAGGYDGFGFGGAAPTYGGTSGSTGAASGGTGVIASGGGDGIAIPPATGGVSTLDGGQIPITQQQRSSLVAMSCTGFSVERENVSMNLELLVDTSASMGQTGLGAVGSSDWEVTRDALLQTLDQIPSSTRVGLVLFPAPEVMGGNSPASCGELGEAVVSAELGELGSAQRALISQRLQGVTPVGSTPLLDAYQFAIDEVRKATGPQVVLVATDGAPTVPVCGIGGEEGSPVDPEPIIDRIQSAYSTHGVRTIMVGSPRSDANRRWLSDASIHGGTADTGCDGDIPLCHVDLGMNPDLASQLGGLRSVVGRTTDCTFQITEAPGQVLDFDRVSVLLSDSVESWMLLQDAVGACTTGFQLAGHTVTLCPDSCALAQRFDVQILVGCITTAR